jgi:hypothetical protein
MRGEAAHDAGQRDLRRQRCGVAVRGEAAHDAGRRDPRRPTAGRAADSTGGGWLLEPSGRSIATLRWMKGA